MNKFIQNESAARLNSNTEVPMQKFLTKSEAAKFIGVTPAAVMQAADSGRLRIAARSLTGVRLFLQRDVDKFIEQRRHRARLRKQILETA